jgi:hypothetical protein
MILALDPGLIRVSKDHFSWFCKMAKGKVMKFSNGTGHYTEGRLVAAEIRAIPSNQYFVRTAMKGVK